MSRRWSDVDKRNEQFFKLFSPFQNDFGDNDDEELDHPATRQSYGGSSSNSSSSRQEYLRSFTFSRKQTLQERAKSRLGRLKAAACPVVACNYYYSLPRRIRRMKDKLPLISLHSPRTPGVRLPLLQGTCFRAEAMAFPFAEVCMVL